MALLTQYCTKEEICSIFNEHRYFERFQEGEFFAFVTEGPASPPGAPTGGRSQTVRYVMAFDHTRTVAVVHQRAGDKYGNPLGADRPDPKRLVHGGVDYRYSPHAR